MSELIPLLDMQGKVTKEIGTDVLPFAVRHLLKNQNAIIKKLNATPKFTKVAPSAKPASKKRK